MAFPRSEPYGGTCAMCRWWVEDDPQHNSPRAGICEGNRTHVYENGPVIVETGKRGAGPRPLQTNENFGCNQGVAR